MLVVGSSSTKQTIWIKLPATKTHTHMHTHNRLEPNKSLFILVITAECIRMTLFFEFMTIYRIGVFLVSSIEIQYFYASDQ